MRGLFFAAAIAVAALGGCYVADGPGYQSTYSAQATVAPSGDPYAAPGAYAAYRRAAELAPGGEEFERCIAQAVFAGWNARLAEEVSPLIDRFGARLRGSHQLTREERGEVEVIVVELAHALAGGRADAAECHAMIENGSLTPRQALRVAISGIQAADQDYDSRSVAAIAEVVKGLPIEDAYSHHLARQVSMVHAISTGRLERGCNLAAEELAWICRDLPAKDRCRPLLSSRVPFWFDCDFERVEQIINATRMALRSYAGTIDALRTEDVYATHCLDMMRLDEAENAIGETSELAKACGFRGLQENFAELKIRLRIARVDESVADAVSAELRRGAPLDACARHRTFALCNAVVGLARVHDLPAVEAAVVELECHWERLRRSCPFDYAVVALAIGWRHLNRRGQAVKLLGEYAAAGRVAAHPPSPFVAALAKEFKLKLD